MKATVQYDDFIGTSAADINDFISLSQFIAQRGVDTNRYEAIGASFYTGDSTSFSAFIICIDNEKSSLEKKHIVKMGFKTEFGKDDFFNLFKRFEVVISKNYDLYQENRIDEEIRVNDIPKPQLKNDL